jgi:hypothetical protein
MTTSRNRREGQYVGHAMGRAVRWRPGVHWHPRSFKARSVLRLRGVEVDVWRSGRCRVPDVETSPAP